jgi:hypothetical protein
MTAFAELDAYNHHVRRTHLGSAHLIAEHRVDPHDKPQL